LLYSRHTSFIYTTKFVLKQKQKRPVGAKFPCYRLKSGRGHVREKEERGEKKKGKGKEKREERVIPSTRISIPIEL
jgi:hypothetical protein